MGRISSHMWLNQFNFNTYVWKRYQQLRHGVLEFSHRSCTISSIIIWFVYHFKNIPHVWRLLICVCSIVQHATHEWTRYIIIIKKNSFTFRTLGNNLIIKTPTRYILYLFIYWMILVAIVIRNSNWTKKILKSFILTFQKVLALFKDLKDKIEIHTNTEYYVTSLILCVIPYILEHVSDSIIIKILYCD